MNTVIGPFDAATWYCMRQCSETIRYLTPMVIKEPIYRLEIDGEKKILQGFYDEVLGRKAA